MGSLNVAAGSLVYLDSVAVIYSMEKFPEYWPRLRPLWERSARREITLCSSELTLLETLVGPIKHGNAALADEYERLLSKTEFRPLPITPPVLTAAARLRVESGLKTPDAIHAATALLAKCDAFVTNDSAFTRVAQLPTSLIGTWT